MPGDHSRRGRAHPLARKVFRLLKSVNELQALLSPSPKDTPLSVALLSRVKSALLATFLALDQVVWLGRSGIYKNAERVDLCSRLSLYCWMFGSATTSVIEVSEMARLSKAVARIEREIRMARESPALDQIRLNQERKAKLAQSGERTLSLVKASLDVFVAIGLLQLAPKTVTPRVTGALGFITSLISMYQLFPPQPKTIKEA
eukprot:SM000281S10757  [mRNA]  locus=s281:117755:119428:- [translate_table: standard]